jgi:hypothetical protein
MTTRRAVIRAMSALIMTSASLALAQPTDRVPRIGVLLANDPAESKLPFDILRLALREAGWVEGKNIIIEYRWAEGKPECYPELAAELVRLNVNVILTGGDQLTLVLKRTTSTIPIVMSGVGNRVAASSQGIRDRGWFHVVRSEPPRQLPLRSVLRRQDSAWCEACGHARRAGAPVRARPECKNSENVGHQSA